MTVLVLRNPADAELCQEAVGQHLADGGIIAYPTETVYGLGTTLQADALRTLARLKAREAGKPFLVLDTEPTALPGLHWNEAALLLAATFWPGPLSLALPADDSYSPLVRSATGTVAVRDTPHEALRALLQRLRQPLTTTSANLPGEAPATSLPELLAVLAGLAGPTDVLVLDGGLLPASAPSTVVDCAGPHPRLVRQGAVPLQSIQSVLQQGGYSIDVG